MAFVEPSLFLEESMFDIILISHGPFSKAILESAQLICGEQENVKTFGLYLGAREHSREEYLVTETIYTGLKIGLPLVTRFFA